MGCRAVIAAIRSAGLKITDQHLPVLDDEAQRCQVRPAG